ncbi:enoyl-CoA hydratase/isomerase family protein [soil metagenome]
MEDAEVLFSVRGPLGHIVLNRPRAINALTHGMVVAIAAQLEEWAVDPSVERVLLTGAGERGLCAGGDIVAMYRDATTGDGTAAEQFWRDEYHLDARIARYPKPVIAIMDGVVLGGGVGISAHASHRVVTERSKIGMPETTIGYIPDVGGLWLLARPPGELGTYLALSGETVGPGDAIALGLADYYVPSHRLVELVETTSLVELVSPLVELASPLVELVETPPAPVLLSERSWIDDAFAGDDLSAILSRVAGRPIADVLAAKSPTALVVTLAALRRARTLPTLEEGLAQDLRVSLRNLTSPDFAEGIRAQVVDKDRNPRWNPARVEDVTGVEAFFAPLERELWTP